MAGFIAEVRRSLALLQAEAESHFMSEQVHSFLQELKVSGGREPYSTRVLQEDRIPAMAPSQEEPDGVDQGAVCCSRFGGPGHSWPLLRRRRLQGERGRGPVPFPLTPVPTRLG